MQADYAQRYRTLWDRHWWWRSREKLLVGEIERIHRRSPLKRILDVGCGDGLFFDQLSRFGRVEGLEPDPSLLSDPRWRSSIRTDRLDHTFQAEAPYDLLLMLDVLEHIEDDREALRSSIAALRPGGTLLITVPALPRLWSRHDEANQHYRRYLPRTLKSVLLDAGFAIDTLRYAFAWTVGPLLARRWLAPSGSASGVADYEVTIPSGPINRALNALSRCDHAIGRLVPWPIGSSLLAIAHRPPMHSAHGISIPGRSPVAIADRLTSR
ncbi:class I SAM-dependent methyltransferase [Tundrisphaera lichenicola]|uniref:class I SAM-dependent methyltransferase n=1 Tax=Tundrisphaera lichenicola TaxID=2029860 RepID=UPI003EBD5669